MGTLNLTGVKGDRPLPLLPGDATDKDVLCHGDPPDKDELRPYDAPDPPRWRPW